MARRIVIEAVEVCEHGLGYLPPGELARSLHWNVWGCPGGSRRVLDAGSYVLIEKVDGEWPEWAKQAVAAATEWKAQAPRFEMHGYTIRQTVLDILDALAGGEQP